MNINTINTNIHADNYLKQLQAESLDTDTSAPQQTQQESVHHTHNKSAQSSQDDAAEELGMMFSEKMEHQTKTHNEKTKQQRNKSIFRINMLEELYSLLGNRSESSLEKSIETILSYQALSLDSLLSEADNDPTKADILLSLAMSKESTKGKQNPQLQNIANELRQKFEHEICAGVNTASALAAFSQDPHQRHAMRNLYYSAVVGNGTVHAIFDALLSQFDEKHFNQGIHALLRAMNDDLSSHTPSLPQNQLRLLLKDLSASQQLSQIFNRCRSLLEKMQNKHLYGTGSGLSTVALTKKTIDLTQSNVYPREIRALSDEAVGRDAKAHLLFLNSFYPIVKELPLPIWKGTKARQGVLNLVSRIMDDYAQQERQENAIAMKSQSTAL